VASLPALDRTDGAAARERAPRVQLARAAPVVAVPRLGLVLPAQRAVAKRTRVEGTGSTSGGSLNAPSGKRGAVLGREGARHGHLIGFGGLCREARIPSLGANPLVLLSRNVARGRHDVVREEFESARRAFVWKRTNFAVRSFVSVEISRGHLRSSFIAWIGHGGWLEALPWSVWTGRSIAPHVGREEIGVACHIGQFSANRAPVLACLPAERFSFWIS
jgi:hypothetical protein